MHTNHKTATRKKRLLCICRMSSSNSNWQSNREGWAGRLVNLPTHILLSSDSCATLLFQPRSLFGRLLASSCPEGGSLTSGFKGYRYPAVSFGAEGFCCFQPKGMQIWTDFEIPLRVQYEELTGCIWYGTGDSGRFSGSWLRTPEKFFK